MSLYKNSFSEETRAIFDWNKRCWKCGRTDRGTEADHITKRKFDFQKSAYNLAPLCRPCHTNKTSKDIPELLKRTREFLEYNNYTPKEIDYKFLKYAEDYE